MQGCILEQNLLMFTDATFVYGASVKGQSRIRELCAQTFKSAHAALFLVMLSFVTLASEISIHLFSTYVRPPLEYVIRSSSHYLKKEINHVDCCQRPGVRMVKG